MNHKETKKKERAVALKYEHGRDQAPIVQAKGEGAVARRIIEKAKENAIPIQEDPDLVSMLAQLDLNQMIPQELYGAVAEIFAFIYKIDDQYKQK
ncbi:EscU/YscU/HrcU family type III secretion system export apparatus switch protein [Sporolactobacillus spathodeae]|uniref:Flagellar biosynthesis protein n=1 Tax=Sporolactobacillus spathodeae TaxID=1465502 RepID=A0ABS2Q6X7_9BACL|nr:EscU/YscU/HrcU family type III secretion system export apparatus switch protein [Sporolactobacillus spathodeae]MBM7656934.1 flagellar biosynthesis protein [Sporolactobacillus spathodeae]